MILVAGIGNIFMGDDAFGSEVARRLAGRVKTSSVRVIDFGIRGFDLAYSLMDEYDATIMIDATQRGSNPGTIYVIEPDLDELDETKATIEAHAMDPVRMLALARSMGAKLKNIHIVGCEPETFGPDGEGQMGLSPCVAAAVDEAVLVVEELLRTNDIRVNQEAS
jgi:hydrogenase maturation protease